MVVTVLKGFGVNGPACGTLDRVSDVCVCVCVCACVCVCVGGRDNCPTFSISVINHLMTELTSLYSSLFPCQREREKEREREREREKKNTPSVPATLHYPLLSYTSTRLQCIICNYSINVTTVHNSPR